jgi:hypothetical protein
VWQAIALHTSAGIADTRSPECALVHWGAAIDVVGLGVEQMPAAVVTAVLAAFPRRDFTDGFADLLEASATRSPHAYAMTFMSDTVNRLCGTGLPNFDERLRLDPFATPAD